jgi:hypothetical protein
MHQDYYNSFQQNLTAAGDAKFSTLPYYPVHRRIEYAQRLKYFNAETPLLGLDRTPEHYCRSTRNLECFTHTVGDTACSSVEYIHPSHSAFPYFSPHRPPRILATDDS